MFLRTRFAVVVVVVAAVAVAAAVVHTRLLLLSHYCTVPRYRFDSIRFILVRFSFVAVIK